MPDTIILFEDEGCRGLLPLIYARPVYTLRCGIFTARERVEALLGQPVHGLARAPVMGFDGPPRWFGSMLAESSPITLLNGRSLTIDWLERLLADPVGTTYVTDPGPSVVDRPVLLGARLTPALASAVIADLVAQQAGLALQELRRFTRVVECDAPLLAWPWDLITRNGDQIIQDLPLLLRARPHVQPYRPDDAAVVMRAPEHVYADQAARIEGPVVLDARDGPVVIDGARIEPFSFIQGPCYIGPSSWIASARIRGETSIGPVCRIGGEVEASIVQAYSNKHHDGFLGHSYVGEWVNIGAMTTNSDLKNTYGSIRMVLEGFGQIDSGVIKLGCFLADHVKLGIGLHMTGGAIIGTGSNIFGVHFAPKTVPPFTWGGEIFREYRIDAMIEVARRVMARRKVELGEHYEQVLRAVHAGTRLTRLPLTGLAPVTPGVPAPAEEQALRRAELMAIEG